MLDPEEVGSDVREGMDVLGRQRESFLLPGPHKGFQQKV